MGGGDPELDTSVERLLIVTLEEQGGQYRTIQAECLLMSTLVMNLLLIP